MAEFTRLLTLKKLTLCFVCSGLPLISQMYGKIQPKINNYLVMTTLIFVTVWLHSRDRVPVYHQLWTYSGLPTVATDTVCANEDEDTPPIAGIRTFHLDIQTLSIFLPCPITKM